MSNLTLLLPQGLVRPLTLGVLAVALHTAPGTAQPSVGDVVTKDAIVRSVPAGGERTEPLELVRASVGQLTQMRTRTVDGRSSAVLDHREVFLALHGRPRVGISDWFDRAVVALRADAGYKVVFVAESDVEFIQRVATLRPPGLRGSPHMLHVRFAQTGSGSVTRNVLYALEQNDTLVEVPIIQPDLANVLAEGESLCCGRFTAFDDERIQQVVFITRGGKAGITHRIEVDYELEGRFSRANDLDRYVPVFRVVPRTIGERRPQKP